MSITLKQDELIFSLNEEDKTASIIGSQYPEKEICIPRSINHESQEFVIKSIKEGAFRNCRFESLRFSADSELQVIEKNAFASSSLNTLIIPSTVTELKEAWCRRTFKLVNVTVDERNPYFKNSEENSKLILGKSDTKSDNFDVIVFASRGMEDVTIPSNIKIIGPFSFCFCQIKKIFIPHHITEIQKGCFCACNYLQKVEFAPDSKLETIGRKSFMYSKIESILIPRSIKRICRTAFKLCEKLQKVEFAPDSELQIIERKAFMSSTIECISIPQNVSVIEDEWCRFANNLNDVKVNINNRCFKNCEENEKLILGKSDINSEKFDVLVFASRNVQEVKIPEFIEKIASNAFAYSKIHSIFIPQNIKIIGESAFSNCKQLRKVEISQNSNLQLIEKEAFGWSSIESFFVPYKVTKINSGAFYCCKKIRKFVIPVDSNLQVIGNSAFDSSSITSIFIPSHFNEIGELNLFRIKIIEFDANVDFQSINLNDNNSFAIIMIPANLNHFNIFN